MDGGNDGEDGRVGDEDRTQGCEMEGMVGGAKDGVVQGGETGP